MKTQSTKQLPTYERVGQYYRIHFNETIDQTEEGDTLYSYDTAKVSVLATRSQRIEALMATRYSIAEEIATINNKDEHPDEYQAYQDFRDLCKQIADAKE